jgi:hypothetical protein
MTTPTTEDVRRALQTLTEGVPGRNEPHRTGTGELDNGEVRQALAGAAFTAVLRSEPGDAFDELAHYFDASQLVGWFGTRRAELILEMLLYQTGWTTYSTWNSVRERELRQLGTRPDRRWLDVCSRVKTESARLERLATALRERVAPGPL